MTTPASVWRNSYITSRLPYSSGTTGQISSAPFVLNKNLAVQTGASGANADRPFEVANGLVTHASHANIIPIAVPAEYAILETWMVITGTHVLEQEDTLPILNIYGKTSFHNEHAGNMPDDYETISNWPANLREWWSPLFMTDRTTPATSTGTATGAFNTGVNDTDVDQVNGSGSFEMHAFGFEARSIPVPHHNAVESEPHDFVAKIGDGTAAALCYPSQTFFLNGSDTVLTTVTTALAAGSGSLGSAFLMGRFHG